MELKWLKKMVFPLPRLFTYVTSRFRFRNNGLLMLHQEVKECEYKDVHIMWEMLHKSNPDFAETNSKRAWKLLRWARFAPCLGHF